MNKVNKNAANLNSALQHLQKVDPVLSSLLVDLQPYKPYSTRTSFESLVRIIIGQQLSTQASSTIFNRLKRMIGVSKMTPESITNLPDQLLLSAGLSRAKLLTVRRLSQHISSGNLNLRKLRYCQDEQVVAELTAIKGIGPWTAQMYLMFVLHRHDVFPSTDGGVIRAIKMLYKRTFSEESLRELTQSWSPYRTIACWYLWRYLDSQPLKQNPPIQK